MMENTGQKGERNMERLSDEWSEQGMTYARDIRALVVAGTSGLVSGRPDRDLEWSDTKVWRDGSTSWYWGRDRRDGGSHVSLIVEDRGAPSVRVILLTANGFTRCDAVFTAVPPLVVAVAIEGMLAEGETQ